MIRGLDNLGRTIEDGKYSGIMIVLPENLQKPEDPREVEAAQNSGRPFPIKTMQQKI
jgi:hypothetical protein